MDKNLIYRKLGQNIQHLRKQTGITQAGLAERIDRSEDAVSNIERGASAPPPETALAIAQALELQLTDLYDLDLTGKPIPQDVKDFLRDLRPDLATMSEAKRHTFYGLWSNVKMLATKK
jgi:DNA-binding XRE family transcriptional regulator